MKSWLTVAESAIYAGVSRDTIYTACERRELRHARIGAAFHDFGAYERLLEAERALVGGSKLLRCERPARP